MECLIKELKSLCGKELIRDDGTFMARITSDIALPLMICKRLDEITEEMKKLSFQLEQLQTEIRHLPIE